MANRDDTKGAVLLTLGVGLWLLLGARTAGALEPSPGPAPPPATPAATPSVADDEPIEEVDELAVVADDGSPLGSPLNQPRLERVVNVLLGRTTRPGALLLAIDHRPRQEFTTRPGQDLLGYEGGGLKVGLGVRYGLFERLDLGVAWINRASEVFSTYELDARVALLRQESAPVDLGLRGGMHWFAQPDAQDATAPFGQLLVSRTFGRRLLLGSGLLFAAESSGPAKSTGDDDWSAAVPALVELRLLDFLALDAEVVTRVAGYGADHPAASLGLKLITARHSFNLIVSNTQYFGADGIVANTPRPWDEPLFGFTITREQTW